MLAVFRGCLDGVPVSRGIGRTSHRLVLVLIFGLLAIETFRVVAGGEATLETLVATSRTRIDSNFVFMCNRLPTLWANH